MGQLSQAEWMVLGASSALALASAFWVAGRKPTLGTGALGEPVWATVAALVLVAVAATVWLGVHDGQ